MAQLKEGSVIKKKTGDELIATLADTLEIRETDSFLLSLMFAGVLVRREELDFIENENPFLLKSISNPFVTTMYFCYWDESGENLTIAPFDRESAGLRLFLPKDGSDGTSSILPSDNYLLVTMLTMINDRVKTDVPEGAKFTDTVTTINGKTGSITKADITALGIPAQDTVVDISSKADKTYVDNQDLKQMSISGGVLENYTEKVIDASNAYMQSYIDIDLSLASVFKAVPAEPANDYCTARFLNAEASGATSFTLIISYNTFVVPIAFPTSVKWQGGEIPDLTNISKTYVLTFMTIDGGTNWLGMFGVSFNVSR